MRLSVWYSCCDVIRYDETMEIQGFTTHVLAALNGVVPKNVSKVRACVVCARVSVGYCMVHCVCAVLVL